MSSAITLAPSPGRTISLALPSASNTNTALLWVTS